MNLGPEIQCNDPVLDILGNTIGIGDKVAVAQTGQGHTVCVREISDIKWYRHWSWHSDTTVPPDRYGHRPDIKVFDGEPYAIVCIGKTKRRSNQVAKVATP